MGNFYFGSDLFSEFDRLQRQMSSLFGGFPSSIRSGAFGAFPAVNIGSTDDSVEIVAFAPGMNAADVAARAKATIVAYDRAIAKD